MSDPTHGTVAVGIVEAAAKQHDPASNTPVQQRRSEAELLLANKKLEERTEELEAFSYSVSHDLRAPLRHIMGFVSLLREDAAPSLSEKGTRYLNTIGQSAKRMGDLIDDLLNFSRVSRAEMQTTDVDLDHLLRDTLGDFRLETEGRHIEWKIHRLPVIRADYALMRMAFVNLISNAVKFTRGRAEATIEVGCATAANGEAAIFVRDNGAGFDPRYAGKLFGVFQRLHSQEEFEGTGIGLANVKRIVQRLGGRVWADAVLDGGAVFYFSIPAEHVTRCPDAA